MFINQVNQVNRSNTFKRYIPKEQLAKQRALCVASIDIYAKKPVIKMPENSIEKEALLEVLGQRLKLDRLIRLNYDKLAIRSQLSEIEDLSTNDPQNPRLAELKKGIEKRGNISSVLSTLSKQIELEEKRNQPAIRYFEELDKTFEELLDKKILKLNQIDKFWHQTVKNNINPNGKYSIAELIEIIESGESPNTSVAKSAPKKFSRTELLLNIGKQYKKLMRENINVYVTAGENEYNNKYASYINARQQIKDRYAGAISKYPGIEKDIEDLYKQLEKEYKDQIESFENTQIYPIGQIWDDMRPIEFRIKKLTAEIAQLKEKSASEPNNQTLKIEIAAKKVLLTELREDWIRGMNLSVKYEAINRSRLIDAGKVEAYDDLVSENKIIKRHKLAYEIANNNNGNIPESEWANVLG